MQFKIVLQHLGINRFLVVGIDGFFDPAHRIVLDAAAAVVGMDGFDQASLCIVFIARGAALPVGDGGDALLGVTGEGHRVALGMDDTVVAVGQGIARRVADLRDADGGAGNWRGTALRPRNGIALQGDIPCIHFCSGNYLGGFSHQSAD
jgi:hypothetical protein